MKGWAGTQAEVRKVEDLEGWRRGLTWVVGADGLCGGVDEGLGWERACKGPTEGKGIEGGAWDRWA